MVEKLIDNKNLEGARELEAAGAEREKNLAENLEKQAKEVQERQPESAELEARHEALEQAKSKEDEPIEAPEKPAPSQPVRLGKKDLDIRFNQTMQHIQKDMSPASRTFSKIIHHPVVDKTSEVVGNTVARPNLILAGGIGTLTLGLIVYLIAKHYGYVLSGSEAIGTFVLGWLIGAVVEFVRIGFKGRSY